MKKTILWPLLFLLAVPVLRAQTPTPNKPAGQPISLDNGAVNRTLNLAGGKITTASITLAGKDYNFLEPGSPEFSFLADGVAYDGASGWSLQGQKPVGGPGKGVELTFRSTAGCPLELALVFELYPGQTAMRKSLRFINRSAKEVMLEGVEVEKLQLHFYPVLFSSYGRQKHLGAYLGDWDDALAILHEYALNGGLLLANEAPGVLKGMTFNKTTMNDIAVGLSGPDAPYPFRKYLAPGAEWQSPAVISMPYLDTADPWQAMNGPFAAFQRNHSGYTIYAHPERRLDFMYNNYIPFHDNYDEKTILELAAAAAECGIRQFTIDCGWFSCKYDTKLELNWVNSCGDWTAHPVKFPNGMKPVFDRIRELGLEPGLWVSVASASDWAEVFRSHPQWRILDKKGRPTNLHDRNPHLRTMCFGTDWKTYIHETLRTMAREWGIRYFKLDLTAATSAYVNEIDHSGCYATDHPGHKDHAESYIAIFEGLFDLFDQLHAEFPGLYIDCTFETEGRMQAIDYAFRRHAEGNWLTNFEEPYPTGPCRIRNLAWWRSPAVPASSMLIGNRRLDTPEAIDELRTMMGTFPILLGDLRTIPAEKRAEIKRWSQWILSLKQKYQYDLFRSDLPGFGEPAEGSWDAYARINTDTKGGGIVGIFRQGAPDDRRKVLIPGLLPDALYAVKGDPSSPGFQTLRLSGRQLAEEGFEVHIPERYAGRLFEIELLK